jgi:DNA-binding NarL/FixJ family response regulator
VSATAARAKPRPRVLIAAEHPATRAGVRLALGETMECSEADDVDRAVKAALRDQPDVCVVDFEPARRGIRAAAEIAAKVPDARVVVMTRLVNEDDFIVALRSGVAGYVSEEIDPSRLPHLVEGLMAGEPAVPRRFVQRLIDELRSRGGHRYLDVRGPRRVELTPREWDVLDSVRQGMSTSEIAQLLGIAEVTVRRHVGGLYGKLGVRSRAELMRIPEKSSTDSAPS